MGDEIDLAFIDLRGWTMSRVGDQTNRVLVLGHLFGRD